MRMSSVSAVRIFLYIYFIIKIFLEGGGEGWGGGLRDPPVQSVEALRVVCLENGIFETYIANRSLMPCTVT